MPWISIREATALVRDYHFPDSFVLAHEIAAKAVKDGCGHPKRFVRGAAFDGLAGRYREPDIIKEPLDPDAYVDLDGARIEGGARGYRGKSYRDVEVHAEKFLAHIEEEDLLGWFGILTKAPRANALAKQEQARPRGPKPGQLRRYEGSDRALIPEVKRLIKTGMSATQAAQSLAKDGRLSGVGNPESRAKRLVTVFHAHERQHQKKRKLAETR